VSAAPARSAALPDLDELLALRGASHGLTLRSQAGSRGLLHGAHQSAQRGRGMEFQEVRPYVAGDDPRTIDWRVTARRGRPHTKLFREERERPVWLLVDLSPALFFGSHRQLKSALVVRAAALLAWVAARDGDRVGALIGAAHGVRVIAPRAREAGVLPLLEALLSLQPTAPAAAGEGAAESLRALAALLRSGSLVCWLSDFAGLNAAVTDSCAGLTRSTEWRLFWITDALERRGLPDGRFRAGLPGRLQTLDGAGVRGRWLAAWRQRTAQLEALSTRLVAPVVPLDTGEAAEQILRPALQRRPHAA